MRPPRAAAPLAALALGAALTALVALRVGAVNLPWSTLLRALFADVDGGAASALVALRVPRVLFALTVGAALASSGAALQGVFRNPLADPALLGVSSGAALAASAYQVFGRARFDGAGLWTLPLVAFAGGALASTAVWLLGGASRRGAAARLVLAGVAVNALCGAATGVVTFVATDAQLRGITFWAMGSVGAATWSVLLAAAVPTACAMAALARLGAQLDALALGDDDAAMLGVPVARVRRAAVLASSLAVGATVAFAGVVGFVGLAVPHLARRIVGVRHAALLPAAALLGGALLTGADAVARTAVAPAELPLGVVCACAGAPFMAWLLARGVDAEEAA